MKKLNISQTKKASISKKLRDTHSEPPRIHVIPQRGGWAVKKEGAKRAAAVVASKSTAIDKAKSIGSLGSGRDVVVHKEDGTISREISIIPVSSERKKSSGKHSSAGK